jgi:hypothetical protein
MHFVADMEMRACRSTEHPFITRASPNRHAVPATSDLSINLMLVEGFRLK